MPYGIRAKVNYLYGVPASERGDGLVSAFSVLNSMENCTSGVAWAILRKGKGIAPKDGERQIIQSLANKVLLALFSASLNIRADHFRVRLAIGGLRP